MYFAFFFSTCDCCEYYWRSHLEEVIIAGIVDFDIAPLIELIKLIQFTHF